MKASQLIKELQSLPADADVGSYDQQYVPKFQSVTRLDTQWQVYNVLEGYSAGEFDSESDAEDHMREVLIDYISEHAGQATDAILDTIPATTQLQDFVAKIYGHESIIELRTVVVL